MAAGVKGVAFRGLLVWLEETRGREFLVAAANRMPLAMRGLLDPARPALGTLPSTWYEATLVHALLDSVSAGMTPTEKSMLARDGSRAVMEATLTGIYKRLISAFATPTLYARFADKLWRSYYASGEFVVQNAAAGNRADTTIKDWDAHHPLACEMNIEAASAIYRAMGLIAVETKRVTCVSSGAPLCHFVTTWTG